MDKEKTLDLREKAKLAKELEKSSHIVRLGQSSEAAKVSTNAILTSAPVEAFLGTEANIAPQQLETPADFSEKLRDFQRTPFSPANFHPEPVIWEGYLHGHNPDLARVGIFILFLLFMAGVAFFYADNLITAFLFLSIIFALAAHILKDKELGNFKVDEIGVEIHGRLYRYKDIESFWIDYHPNADIKELSLHLSTTLHPYLKVPLHSADPVQLRRLMLHYIPEIEHKPNFADALSRHLRI